MPEEVTCTGSSADVDGMTLRLADPDHEASEVRLWSHLPLTRTDLEQVEGGWELRLDDPPVECLEYLFEVDGEGRLDPGNPVAVGGAFGEHSFLPMPHYDRPAWLDWPQVESEQAGVLVEDTPVGDVEVTVWAPADADGDDALPMLFAHDGPEMASYGMLLDYAGAMIGAGRLRPMRIALLEPGARNERYAANPAYAEALTGHVVPAILDACPTAGRPVLTGQSLGAVAALHAAWTSPETFGGLLLQSGSFFTDDLDPQERGFELWAEVTGFVSIVHAAEQAAPGAPYVAMTAGSAEENYANNCLMVDQLRRVGMDVTWGERPQGHTWTCWRDLLDPHLTTLLRKVWA
jgi:enterochelin esterase family protein